MMQIQEHNIHHQIGDGGFASVYYAETIKEKEPRALKCISLDTLIKEPYKLKYLDGEIDALKKLDSPNIIKLKSQYVSDNFVCLFTEYCNKDNLQKYIRGQPQQHLNEPETINIMIDILTGLGTMHRNEYIHRDLKPENIFLNEENGNLVAKIGDLGFTKKLLSNQLTHTCLGTDGYMAPEIIQKQPYNSKVDVWGLGCIIFEMLYGTVPFQLNWGVDTVRSYYTGQKLQIEQIIRDNRYITREKNNIVSSDMKQLLINMLSIQPQDRFGFDDIYRHTLFIKNKQIEQLKKKNEAYYKSESQIYKENNQEEQNDPTNYDELLKIFKEKIGKVKKQTTQQKLFFSQD
ncbi:Protein kinase-like domain [Pseudocohnilembus persalinus]|uniref:Protein kinase-like domain n=1 Tax=Pseudocohnilembus persalinus TaxID=266149 RepID=A0A0V0R7U4_PSEPJ|nr:Protein kinase-like domain [Pseudocohnilembus persalinus]|eukprot:KRX10573.1 Protein kinase-like domain [Pseudocohnilembus persalinus]